MTETNRDVALRGGVVLVTNGRLRITADPIYHWHFAAIVNELIARRAADVERRPFTADEEVK